MVDFDGFHVVKHNDLVVAFLTYFLEFSPPKIGGCMIQFDGQHIFQMGW